MKTYVLRFGQTNPTNYTGLTPTFTVFAQVPGGTLVTPPGITESPASSGIYSFGFSATTLTIAFKVDGGATLSSVDRYIVGVLDPIQAVDEKMGWLTDSFGSTSADPTTVVGYLKRLLEDVEGTSTFNKTSGLLTMLSRGMSQGVSVSPTALVSHTVTNGSGTVTKY